MAVLPSRARTAMVRAGGGDSTCQGCQAGFAHARFGQISHNVETDGPLSPQVGPERKGAQPEPAAAPLARRRHDPATGAGAARRSARPRRDRHRAHAAAIGRARHRRRRGRTAGRRTARRRRRIPADAERHVQSAAHPCQRAAPVEPDRKRTHRHRACAQRGRRLERDRRHSPHAGVSGHVVSRPAAAGQLAGQPEFALRWRAATG